MTLRIEPLFGDEIDPWLEASAQPQADWPAAELALAHIEDRLLVEFDAFLAGRDTPLPQRGLGRELLLEALEQIGDPESGWERLSLRACVAKIAGDSAASPPSCAGVRLSDALVAWLSQSGRLAPRARRKLQLELAPVPAASARRSAPLTKLRLAA